MTRNNGHYLATLVTSLEVELGEIEATIQYNRNIMEEWSVLTVKHRRSAALVAKLEGQADAMSQRIANIRSIDLDVPRINWKWILDNCGYVVVVAIRDDAYADGDARLARLANSALMRMGA